MKRMREAQGRQCGSAHILASERSGCWCLCQSLPGAVMHLITERSLQLALYGGWVRWRYVGCGSGVRPII